MFVGTMTDLAVQQLNVIVNSGSGGQFDKHGIVWCMAKHSPGVFVS